MTLCRTAVTLVVAGLAATGVSVEAQDWQGSASLAVRVTDDKGDPIAEAQVLARLSEGDPNSGPATATTSSGGQAVITGLREGEWFVEVSHAGYMLYAAYVDLRAGKKPQVGFSSQVNTETSWAPMTVKFVKASASFNRGSATAKRAEPKAKEVVRPTPQPKQPEPPVVVRPEPQKRQPEPPKVVRPEPRAEAPEQVPETAPETTPETASRSTEDETVDSTAPAPPDDEGLSTEPALSSVTSEESEAEAPLPEVAAPAAAEQLPEAPPATAPPVITPPVTTPPVTAPSVTAPPATATPEPTSAEAVGAASEEIAQTASAQTHSAETHSTKTPITEPASTEAPVEGATVEEAPVGETPVDEGPMAEAPVPEAPVPEAPVPAAEVLTPAAPASEAPVEPEKPQARKSIGTTEPTAAAETAVAEAPPEASGPPQATAAETRQGEPAAPATQAPPTEAPEPRPAIEQVPAPAQPTPPESVAPSPPESGAPDVPAPSASSLDEPVAEVVPPTPDRAETAPPASAPDERAAAPPPLPEPDAAAAPQIGRLPRYLRSAAAGSCSECEAGEWAVASEQSAARTGTTPADRNCPESFLASTRQAAQMLADVPSSRLDDYSGPLLTAMFRMPPDATRSRLQELLGPVTDPVSYCQMAGVVLPRSASFSGYVLEAWDSLGGRSCRADVSCAVGRARWLDEPIVVEGAERTVVYDVFKNGSTRRERRARMTIYFRPPTPDWTPASR